MNCNTTHYRANSSSVPGDPTSHREDWLTDAAHWREATRAIEDKLSDALHERLTQRFVDRRTALLVKKLKDPGALFSSVDAEGSVAVEGHYVGQLDGFRFRPDQAANDPSNSRANRALLNAAGRALRQEIDRRVTAFADAKDEDFTVDDTGRIAWRGDPVGRLVAGRHALAPEIEVLPSDFLDTEQQAALRKRLVQWLADRIVADLAPLLALRDASEQADVPGPLRGILFQMTESLGAVARRDVAAQVAALDDPSRKRLAQMGVRLGVLHLFCPALFRPRAIRRRALLWRIHHGDEALGAPPKGVLSGKPIVTLPPDRAVPADGLRVLGYLLLGPRALRLDQAERLAAEVRKLARQGPFVATAALAQMAGAEGAELAALLEALGYRLKPDETGAAIFVPRKPAHQNHGQRRRAKAKRRAAEDKREAVVAETAQPAPAGENAQPDRSADSRQESGKDRDPDRRPPPSRPRLQERPKERPKDRPKDRPRPPPRVNSDSPFAKLGEMLEAHRRKQGTS